MTRSIVLLVAVVLIGARDAGAQEKKDAKPKIGDKVTIMVSGKAFIKQVEDGQIKEIKIGILSGKVDVMKIDAEKVKLPTGEWLWHDITELVLSDGKKEVGGPRMTVLQELPKDAKLVDLQLKEKVKVDAKTPVSKGGKGVPYVVIEATLAK